MKINLEHYITRNFGITCVDFQASGVIPVGHNSAGPKMDILVPHEERQTGYLAETAEDFAQKMEKIFALKPHERIKIQAWVFQKRGLPHESSIENFKFY